jgi:SAM-dependent methyltransferase
MTARSSASARRLWERLQDARRRRGILGLLAAAPAAAYWRWCDHRERAFDRTYGTETSERAELSSLAISHANVAHGVRYEAILPAELAQILRAIPIEPSRYTFVDYGSGKGRALLLAAQHGFRRAIGVEFSEALARICERNIAAFRASSGLPTPIDVACVDATAFDPPGDDTVFFFYNPFGAPVMRTVLQRMQASLVTHPRSIYVAYRTPACASVFAEMAFLRVRKATRAWIVYELADRA